LFESFYPHNHSERLLIQIKSEQVKLKLI